MFGERCSGNFIIHQLCVQLSHEKVGLTSHCAGGRKSGGDKEGNADAEETPHDYLDRGVPDEFAETFFAHRTALKYFVNHLVEDTSLDTDSTSHAGGVIHDDGGQHNGDGEG